MSAQLRIPSLWRPSLPGALYFFGMVVLVVTAETANWHYFVLLGE